MQKPLLDIQNVSLSFGGIQAIKNFSLKLLPQERLAIIGPNGAGKTSLFNLLSGVYSPSEGDLFFNQRPINQLKSYELCQMGIARTFQNIRLFGNLSVLENVLVAFHGQISNPLIFSAFPNTQLQRQEAQCYKQAENLLKLFSLDKKQEEAAKNLAYGEQRKLEIIRALATKPKLLLLDEPAAGMNLTEKKELMRLINEVQQEYQLALIMIEHDMEVVMNLFERICVLHFGELLCEGTPQEIRQNPKVIEAYLGSKKSR